MRFDPAVSPAHSRGFTPFRGQWTHLLQAILTTTISVGVMGTRVLLSKNPCTETEG